MDKVIDYYSQFDEWGRLDREPLEFTINLHFIKQYLEAASASQVLDNGAGPGKYAIALAKLGYNVTLSDLTPMLVEIAKQKAAEQQVLDQFNGFHVMNATCLEGIHDETYDAALMLGPLYHLQKEEERTAAVRELHRVTKQNGLVFVACQSRMRMAITSLSHPQAWKPNDSLAAIRAFFETGVFNHQDQGRFTGAYYFHADEVKPFMERNGFETIDLIGSSSIGSLLSNEQQQYWIDRGEYDEMIQFLISVANDPSVLGASSHLLYIGKRV
ncbi:class I SAM-dependent methyltransferase [Paenibacillus sp. MMS18-CY102]|uniref:class I SAM-dependent methyltransferase n=1 Tax=Paenibacillus sp. MMS18-CY102 TaxID=2682849 RepID=UPI001365C52B|nr:class I SAM-dependent methyltransferase [Paenibacillus sp. MMS18-CY102]MWC26869.1 methyltransferase domain-containing protein [Paenibacillus sp. MMS18-CY102]